MAKTLEQKVAGFIEVAGAAVEKAEAELQGFQAQQTKAAAAIPSTVQALIAANFIREDEKQAAEKALTDPTKTLQFLARVAEKSAALTKQASKGLGTPLLPATTARRTADKKPEHWEKFANDLNLVGS